MSDQSFLQQAISMARKSVKRGGFPAGAVVVLDGKVVGEGMSVGTILHDPTIHGEIDAIRNACKTLGTSNLSEATLYASMEPCIMCLSAAMWSGISKVYFACGKDKVTEEYYGGNYDTHAINTQFTKPIELTHITELEEESFLLVRQWEESMNNQVGGVMPNPQNNYAFIDAQNLHCGVGEAGWRIDYRRFRIYLRERHKITKAFIFIGYQQKNEPLYTYLQSCGFILIFKQLHPHAPSKGNVDVDLATHAMALIAEYDAALVVTSDGDFASLVSYLKKEGKLLGVMSPRYEKCSLLLRQCASEKMFYLKPVLHKIGGHLNRTDE